jgi:Fic family protein
MQEMWKKVRPDVLQNLRDSAVVQSSESSNRIEGVVVSQERLIPLVLGKAKPRDRSEEEIVGYRKALKWIHDSFPVIEINPKTILNIHKLAQGGMVADAGQWKKKDNEIIEIQQNGERKIRFKCVSAAKTPAAIEQLCLAYSDTLNHSRLPDLICVYNFVFDFLCIHPFRDGNGRTSRLLTTLLLYKNGFEVAKYISLERLIEESKDDYYRILAESSKDWHQSSHDLLPWWNYSLSILKNGYQELKDRVELSSATDSKSAIVTRMILSYDRAFSISDVCNQLPDVSRDLVKKTLAKLKDQNRIAPIGSGRSAKWKRL